MKALAFVSMFASLAVVEASGARADCDAIPPKVAAYLAAKPGWKIVHLTDLGADDQALWWRYRGNACPGFARADLQGNGRWSYGLSLSKGRETQSVILYDDGHTLRERVVWSATDGVAEVVHTVPSGPTYEFGSRRRTDIPHASLAFEVLEASATQYYWRHGRLTDITISD